MTLFPALAVLLSGSRARADYHRAVFRDFALRVAGIAATHRSGSRKAP